MDWSRSKRFNSKRPKQHRSNGKLNSFRAQTHRQDSKMITRKRKPCSARSQNKLTALWTALCILGSASMLMDCSSPTPLSVASPRPPLQPNLIQPCQDLTPLTDGIGATVLRKLIDVSREYYECKLRHEKLVEAVK